MDELTKAIIEAGNELAREYEWTFDGGFRPSGPSVENEFVVVIRKHIAPLLDIDQLINARVIALTAELNQLRKIWESRQ